MFGRYYYNQSMRKMTIAFGQLFNNIQIKRKDSEGDTVQSIKVPLAYAPKEKFLVRLDQQPNLNNRQVSITLPKMSFEITGITYDGSRKLTRMQKYKTVKTNSEGEKMNFNYTPVPYNLDYNLNVYTSSAEGGLQIVEQILPYFQPDYTVTVNAIPELDIKRDIPIILNSVNYEDSYSGDFTTRRAVIYTLGFTAKTYLFGPTNTQKVVKKTQTDLYSDLPESAREERITVEPDPLSANANDDFGFTTVIDFFEDSKKYNPSNDTDEDL
ncbi:tail sheath stabilizer and completion protein [Candidatus Woesearchaeota archaeon]|nr:tail sheath stabilizer and completion protein [Candidatus Woesearchaeota archaeon]